MSNCVSKVDWADLHSCLQWVPVDIYLFFNNLRFMLLTVQWRKYLYYATKSESPFKRLCIFSVKLYGQKEFQTVTIASMVHRKKVMIIIKLSSILI